MGKKYKQEIFLETLPKSNKNGRGNNKIILWDECIGYKVNGIYDNINFEVEIVDYNKNKKNYLTIKYNDTEFEINTGGFVKCSLGKLFKKVTSDFKIEIGTRFKDDKRDITITDREYRQNENHKTWNEKWYKYTCNVCGWTEGWMLEGVLTCQKIGCSCCHGNTAVLGINTIYDTDKWMIPYIGEECAKNYTYGSAEKVKVKCPDCGRVKSTKIPIKQLYTYHSIGCICFDSISFGEKFMFSILEQLGLNFQTQLSKSTFNWCQDYRYDFYFEYNNEQYIIEIQGEQHYKDAWDKLEKTQLNDKNKKELALANDIKEENYIVIDCRKSTLEWINNNDNGILNSRLNKLFDLSKIDWLESEEFALNNRIKEACELWNEGIYTLKQISIIMKLNYDTVGKYLNSGKKIGWCNEKIKRKRGKALINLTDGKLFRSCADCSRKSIDIYNEFLTDVKISAICIGKIKQYKNYKFKYISNLTEKEYIKYGIENKLKELYLNS